MQGSLPISRLAKEDRTKVYYGMSFGVLQSDARLKEGMNEGMKVHCNEGMKEWMIE